jgi:hypothetical protein
LFGAELELELELVGFGGSAEEIMKLVVGRSLAMFWERNFGTTDFPIDTFIFE